MISSRVLSPWKIFFFSSLVVFCLLSGFAEKHALAVVADRVVALLHPGYPSSTPHFTTATVPSTPPAQAIGLVLHMTDSLIGENGGVEETPIQPSNFLFETAVIGKGLVMDRNSRLTYPSAGNILATEGTIELWIKPGWGGNDTQNRTILKYGNSGGLLLSKEGTNLRLALNRTNDNGSLELDVATNVSSWTANQWHYVAASWSNNGKFLRLYVDGTLMSERSLATMTTLPTIDTLNTPLQLGSEGGIRNSLVATIDELAISSVPRTTQEIAARMREAITSINNPVLTPNISAVTLNKGWTYWQDFRFNATTNIGPLDLPAILSSDNTSVAKIDTDTGRIRAVETGVPANVTVSLPGVSVNVAVTVNPIPAPVLETPGIAAVGQIPVAIIRYIPTTGSTNVTDSTNVNATVSGYSSTVGALKTKLTSLETNLKFILEEGSRFRAYKNSSSQAFLAYKVVKIITVYEEVPPGLLATSTTYFPDYKQIFRSLGVQDLVETQGVKEIWLEQYVNGRITLNESNMASPLSGDISSSLRTNDDLPVYTKSYTVFGINFAQTENDAARNQGHHLEALLTYANKRQDGNDSLFQEAFIGRDANGNFQQGRCGKTDRPPNSTQNFEFNNNSNTVLSDIADWFPDGSGGLQDSVNADLTWGRFNPLISSLESKWYIYWRQSIPGANNIITRNGTERMTNWWKFVADWDNAMQVKLGLTLETNCQYELSSASQSFGNSGGSGTVSVSTGAGCPWTVTNDPIVNWITITTAVNNAGNGTVNFTFADNLTTSPRTATLKIADKTHTITQTPNNPVPTLSSLAPATVSAGSPGFTLTLNGTGFLATSTVQVNDVSRATTLVNSTPPVLTITITATEIANIGELKIAVINPAPGGGSSAPIKLFINNPVPVLTSLNQPSALAGSADLPLTVTGMNFNSTSKVRWNGTDRATTLINATQLSATIPATDLVNAGTSSVTVFNPTPGGGTSLNVITFNINNPVPTLSSLNQTSAPAGSADLTLTVTGTNFNSTSKLRWNGVDRTTLVASTTQLSATIPATDLVNAGTPSVTVFNPTPGGGTSNALAFTINNPQLTLTSLTPNTIVAGNSTFNLTVSGIGFLANSVIQWNGNNRPTTFTSSTQLSTSITAADVTMGGSVNVTVFNPTQGSTSLPLIFTTTNLVPTLISLSQTSALAGSADLMLTVTGTNFNSTSKVLWNGAVRTTTLVSGSTTQLSATIPATDLVNAGTPSVTVFNPTPGGGTSNALAFTINNPSPPTVTNLAPNTRVAGGNAFTLIVTGANFLANSVVRWNGTDRPTTLVSGGSTQLSASITADDIKTGGSANVTVFNPAPGGGTSGALAFNITSPCSYTISPTTQSFTSAGGNGSVNVMTTTSCTWTVTSNVGWITINASSGSTIANFTVAANTGANRSGTMTVAGQTFMVTQDAPQTTCTYTLSPVSQNFAASGGNGTFIVTTGTGCTWAATSNDNWITTSVTGTGVSYSVQANTGAARTGTITVAGQTFTVTQDALTTCASQRTLPAEYIVGFSSQVSLQITPPATTTSYAVEEIPPTGWTITAIDNNGVFDAVNNKVKWGPFFDSTVRTLSYTVTPTAGATGQKIFSGTVSFNGTNSAICGATTIAQASQIHPADLNNNLRVEINELTAYGAAWKAGTTWSRAPNPIDINYLTNAGLIWKLGEVYHYDMSKTPPFATGASVSLFQPPTSTKTSLVAEVKPLKKMLQEMGYMPGLGLLSSNPAAFMSGSAIASFNPTSYTPGTGVTVTIAATPDASTNVYAVEDTVPVGWTVTAINNSGAFDSANHKVKWGPYFDNSPRSLMYVITPPTGETGSKFFVGAASFDGTSVSVAGARILAPPLSCSYSLGTASQSLTAVGGVGNFAVITSAGCTWTAATSDAWISITQGTGSGNGAVNFSVITNTGAARSGTISVGGQTFMVNQTAGCTYSLNQLTQNLSATGGTGAFTLTTGAGCGWTAVPSAAWITITSTATGAGNSNISYAVAASDGTARNGSISVGGQVFSVTQAVNAAPTITAAAGISATQNLAANTVTIATVTDTETAAGALTVTALTIPTGITIGTIANTNGTVSAPVSASCSATIGSNSITLKVTDSHGASAMTSLSMNVVSNVNCNPATVDTSAGDHKPGSILIYNYYTSDVSQPSSKNTQIKLTNTSDTAEVTVRMSLIDGQNGNISIVFFCLLPNQTINFLASEYDPSVTGYIIAMAVDKTTGCPVNSNYLMGGAYVKLPTGHVANLPAIAVSAIATTPATCAAGGTTATINFDGAAYSRLPRLLAIDNLSSIKDGNNMILVLNRVGGNLISTAPSIGAISGKMYDTGRVAEDFNFTSSTPQSANTLSVNFPRIGPKKLDLFIPAGQSGWMKIGADSNLGLTGVLFNFSAVRSQYAYSGGNNLQAVVLAGNVTLDIPLVVPNCR